MPSLLDYPDTATVCFQEIERILKQAGYDCEDGTEIKRRPVVFMGNATAGAGDLLPFMRVVTELPQHLEADYHILLLCTTNMQWMAAEVNTELRTMAQSYNGNITIYSGVEEWVSALERTSAVDAIVVNQISKWMRPDGFGGGPEMWQRTCAAMIRIGSALLHMEFLWINTRATGLEEMERACRASLPRVNLQCYPAWLLTDQERARTVGVMWQVADVLLGTVHSGAVEPYISSAARQAQPDLEKFLRTQQAERRKVVMLARGGLASPARYDHDNAALPGHNPEIVEALLSVPEIAVLRLGDVQSANEQIEPRLFTVPYLRVDFRNIFSRVDLVVHHGGAGTTFTALRCGTPQVIVCNLWDCSDQQTQAAKVSELLCGRSLTQRQTLSDGCKDIVDAVQDACLLHAQYRVWCKKARVKILDDEPQSPSIAIQALRKLIAGVVALKQAGKWQGWSGDVIDRDNEYTAAWNKVSSEWPSMA